MPTPILITAATGGLGATILNHLLHTHALPPSSIIATSSRPSAEPHFTAQSILFRHADFTLPSTLTTAFKDVQNLLFISSPTQHTPTRIEEHRNVIEAAKAAGVGKVWYVSLAFGGWGDGSKVGFQQAHYATEAMLMESGLDFVVLRAGVYADAFPLFLNWYPSSSSVLLPRMEHEGEVAWTSREEIGEGIAALLAKGLKAFPEVKPKGEKNIVLLTSGKTQSLTDLVSAVNRARGTDMPVEFLDSEEWIEACAKDDEGRKSREWFAASLVFMQGVCEGDAATVDPALEVLLGRKPETGTQAVERLVRADPEYRWHQNHAR